MEREPRPIFKLRPTSPFDANSHHIGLIMANTKIVGANKRKIGVASDHLGPRTTKIRSSAKRMHAIVIGSVTDTTRE